MAMRLKANQKGPWCSYCDNKAERAVYRDYGFRNFACEYHKDKLPKDPSNHMSKGDWQAFGRHGY